MASLLVALAISVASILSSIPAQAQAPYPNRPIRIVIPFGPGGFADITLRLLGQKLTERTGAQVVIENRPGAGGVVAGSAVLSSPPDGYTLFVFSSGIALSKSLLKTMPFDPQTAFTPVSLMALFDLLLLTKADSPMRNAADMLAAARANPAAFNIGTINPGSTQNLAAELFKNVTGINAQVVPFRTSADMATALLRGDLDGMFEFYTAAHGLLSDKKVVALASTGPMRSAYLPEVPTALEAGIKDFEVLSWNGLSVPAATPKPVIESLVKGLNDVLPDPSIQERSKTLGMEMRGGTPAEMDKRMKDDIVKWGAEIEKAGIEKRD